MKLTNLYETAGSVVQLHLQYYHDAGEQDYMFTEVNEYNSKKHPTWVGPHKNLDDIYWKDEQVNIKEGIRRIDLRYNDTNAISSFDDDKTHKEAVKEFIEKTNKQGKFFYTEYEGVDADNWFVTFFAR